MNTSRRNFLKQGALAAAGVALFPNVLHASYKAKGLLGIQLYSIREDMKKDPAGTLKQVAAMGYKNVEHANYVNRKFYGYSAAEFKKLLNDLGLKMPSGHTVLGKQHWDAGKKDFTDAWKYTVEDAAAVGQQLVISPWLDESLRKTYDDFKAYMDVFNKCGELCKQSGMKFGYHNHDFEFSTELNGKKLFDLILENTDPSLVAQQLDIGNMYHAGGIALDIIKRYPGRFESMHVKDEIKAANKGEMGGGYESTILGKGIIPVKEVIDLGLKSGGTKHFIIEQESYQGIAPLACIKEDYQVMRRWGF
ncbi:sugar phosphate isomerase/epimerase [Chitinophaga pendula]|uniref:sugar phosphate isomerase/epimerase family protein n=1 Tax=Chitinophaga TaxID=79328 RepID=UPI000BAE8CFD|nr:MULTISPECIES: sugar phosphate isomerase/epimerase [Chitinophaga]ASZ12653.1 xylose isomerase [Chitinophaga sp. MD30]UCJ09736.1 sugar phosphate isomerase/epimerase [Chitinophaga pendula]